jgi:hypothetical protein
VAVFDGARDANALVRLDMLFVKPEVADGGFAAERKIDVMETAGAESGKGEGGFAVGLPGCSRCPYAH